MSSNLLYLIVGIIAGVILMSIFKPASKAESCNMDNIAETLLRQSARYAVAAENDISPMIAVLHANYGAGYLFALKDIIGNHQLKNVNLQKFTKHVTDIQDKATQKMIQACPDFTSNLNPYLLGFGKG